MNTRQGFTENSKKQDKIAADRARLAEMRRLYEAEGRTLAEVGKAFGVTRQRVQQLFIKAGVRRRYRRYVNENVPAAVLAEMRRLYEDELFSIEKVARRFGISPGASRQRLIKAGVRTFKQKYPKRQIEAETLQALYVRKRLSLASIEATIGVGRNIVYRELARHGIPTRPRGFQKAAAQADRV